MDQAKYLGMKWDYYAATIPAQWSEINRMLLRLPKFYHKIEKNDREGNYTRAIEYKNQADETIATLLYGGRNIHPHVSSWGDHTPDFVDLIRKYFPQHQVTRFDSCIDYNNQVNLFEEMDNILVNFALRWNLKAPSAGDWVYKVDGRTRYIGGKSSDVKVRWYEKGKKEKHLLMAQNRHEPDWCRLEIEVHPLKKQRQRAATLDPDAIWGFGRWAYRLKDHLMKTKTPRLRWEKPPTVNEKLTLRPMIRGYKNIIRRRLYEHHGGSMESLMLEFGDVVAEIIDLEARPNLPMRRRPPPY